MTSLLGILLSLFSIQTAHAAGVITGGFNSFSQTGLSGPYYEAYQYAPTSTGGASYGNSTCNNLGADFSNKSIEDIGGVSHNATNNDYHLIVISESDCSALSARNSNCGSGKSYADCTSYLVGAGSPEPPYGLTYIAGLKFDITAPSSSPSSTTTSTLSDAVNYADFAVDILGFAIMLFVVFLK